MARPAVTIPSTFARDWTALPTTDGNVGGVAFKPLSAAPGTGAATLLLHLPPGWEGEGSRARGEAEEFVLDGAVRAGGGAGDSGRAGGRGGARAAELTRWGYACRPAGVPAGRYATEAGATLACWWTAAELG